MSLDPVKILRDPRVRMRIARLASQTAHKGRNANLELPATLSNSQRTATVALQDPFPIKLPKLKHLRSTYIACRLVSFARGADRCRQDGVSEVLLAFLVGNDVSADVLKSRGDSSGAVGILAPAADGGKLGGKVVASVGSWREAQDSDVAVHGRVLGEGDQGEVVSQGIPAPAFMHHVVPAGHLDLRGFVLHDVVRTHDYLDARGAEKHKLWQNSLRTFTTSHYPSAQWAAVSTVRLEIREAPQNHPPCGLDAFKATW